MTLATFASDPIVWAQKKRNQWAFLLFLLLPVFGCLLFSPFAVDPLSKGLTAAAILAFLIAVWFLRPNQKKHAFDPLREPRVSVANDHLTYVRENSTITLTFNDLKRLIIRQNHTGAVYKIEVQTAQQTIALDGFQEMDQLAAALLSHAPSTCQIRYRRNWFSVFYPWRWWLLTALFVGLFIWWQMMVYSEPWLITAPFSLYILYRCAKSFSLRANLMLGAVIVLLNLADLMEWVDNEGWNAAALWQQPCSLVQRITRPGLCLRAIENAEYLYFYGAEDDLMWTNESTIVQTPVNSWLGFWTPTLTHERSVRFLRPSAHDQAILATTFDFDLSGNRAFWIWPQNQSTPSGPYMPPDHIADQSIALAPDGLHLAIAGEEGLRLLDVTTGESVMLLAQDVERYPLAFSPDGRYLFSVTKQGQPLMWNVLEPTEPVLWPLPSGLDLAVARAIALSDDGHWLAAAYYDEVIIWDVATQRVDQHLTFPAAEQFQVTALAFAPDGRYLAVGSNYLVARNQSVTHQSLLYLAQMADGNLESPFMLGEAPVQTLDFSRNGGLLAVGTESAGYVLAVDKLLGK